MTASSDDEHETYTPTYPIAGDYVRLLGYAVFMYAMLEWQVVYVGEKLKPGFVNENVGKEGGGIANAFDAALSAASSALSTEVAQRLEEMARKFRNLKDRRNTLIHARPITMPGTERTPGLSYEGRSGSALWTRRELIDAIREFEAAAREANDIYYKVLS